MNHFSPNTRILLENNFLSGCFRLQELPPDSIQLHNPRILKEKGESCRNGRHCFHVLLAHDNNSINCSNFNLLLNLNILFSYFEPKIISDLSNAIKVQLGLKFKGIYLNLCLLIWCLTYLKTRQERRKKSKYCNDIKKICGSSTVFWIYRNS